MMNFCTLFDSYYIHKGIALYRSLENCTNDFHLYVMAFDHLSYDKLKSIGFKRMTVELFEDFETPELKSVKPTRTKTEYCWTAGPSVIHHFLTHYNLDEITYLDADLYFLSDPHHLKDEIANNSIVITEQGISEKAALRYGRYCVQYVMFKNDEDGLGALTWWRDKCIEWCYQYMEPTRYGDQKYLDEFPKRWHNVCVLKHYGAGIAPWNIGRYQYKENTLLYQGKEFEFIFYHMHGVRVDVKDNTLVVRSVDCHLGKDVIRHFYKPYAELLKDIMNDYFGEKIDNCIVYDMGFLKTIEYQIRAWVKKSNFLTDFYIKHIHKREDRKYGARYTGTE